MLANAAGAVMAAETGLQSAGARRKLGARPRQITTLSELRSHQHCYAQKKLTAPQLKAACEERKIAITAKEAKKPASMIKKLNAFKG